MKRKERGKGWKELQIVPLHTSYRGCLLPAVKQLLVCMFSPLWPTFLALLIKCFTTALLSLNIITIAVFNVLAIVGGVN